MIGRPKPDPEEPQDEPAHGWGAIDRACQRVYGSQTPRHVGYPPGVRLGSGLQGCSAYDAGDHWHYVTYGLTELWLKEEGANPAVSGWGYEFTFRLVKNGRQAPGWPFSLLEFLARHTRTKFLPFEVDDRIDREGPLTDAVTTTLVALAVLLDPTLPSTTSDNGAFEFRQLFGITAEELAEMRATSTDAVLDRLRGNNPLLVTDPSR